MMMAQTCLLYKCVLISFAFMPRIRTSGSWRINICNLVAYADIRVPTYCPNNVHEMSSCSVFLSTLDFGQCYSKSTH